MPLAFNVRGQQNEFVVVSSGLHLNPENAITLEVRCCIREPRPDATLIARPCAADWRPPYVVYRLGFHRSTCLPEFELLFRGDSQPTTILAPSSIPLGTPIHLAGTYGGRSMRLYVNGTEVALREKTGTLACSDQPTVFGARSSTAVGGLFAGTLAELRIWEVARAANGRGGTGFLGQSISRS